MGTGNEPSASGSVLPWKREKPWPWGQGFSQSHFVLGG
jgi:hypothetical protein